MISLKKQFLDFNGNKEALINNIYNNLKKNIVSDIDKKCLKDGLEPIYSLEQLKKMDIYKLYNLYKLLIIKEEGKITFSNYKELLDILDIKIIDVKNFLKNKGQDKHLKELENGHLLNRDIEYKLIEIICFLYNQKKEKLFEITAINYYALENTKYFVYFKDIN